jgi:hypothetical protein
VVTVLGHRSRGPGLDSRHYHIFWDVGGLERGPLSVMSTKEELLGRNSSGSGLEIREYGRGDPLRWLHNTLYLQKLALTSPTRDGRSVSIVRSQIKDTEFSFFSLVILLKKNVLSVDHFAQCSSNSCWFYQKFLFQSSLCPIHTIIYNTEFSVLYWRFL